MLRSQVLLLEALPRPRLQLALLQQVHLRHRLLTVREKARQRALVLRMPKAMPRVQLRAKVPVQLLLLHLLRAEHHQREPHLLLHQREPHLLLLQRELHLLPHHLVPLPRLHLLQAEHLVRAERLLRANHLPQQQQP